MTGIGAPSRLGGALLTLAGVALLFQPPVQAGVAAILLIALGLPHGAADLALVDHPHRPAFLLAYGAAVGAVLLLWRLDPAMAVAAFLILSTMHFAWDADAGRPLGARWAEATLLVSGPALLHEQAVDGLFRSIIGHEATEIMVPVLRLAAAGAIAAWACGMSRQPHVEGDRLAGVAALLLLPPLLGFAIGFVLLHAKRETVERMRDLGCPVLAAYVRRVSPVLAAALLLIGAVGLFCLWHAGGEVRWLFMGLSALAVPHMLVTPLWARSSRPSRMAKQRSIS